MASGKVVVIGEERTAVNEEHTASWGRSMSVIFGTFDFTCCTTTYSGAVYPAIFPKYVLLRHTSVFQQDFQDLVNRRQLS